MNKEAIFRYVCRRGGELSWGWISCKEIMLEDWIDINKCEQKTGLPSRLPSPYYALSNTTGLLALTGGLDYHGWDSSGKSIIHC